MDAKQQERNVEREQLLARLAELETEELRAAGRFESTPHMSVLEIAGHELGKRLSRQVVRRAGGEAAAEAPETAPCPSCGERRCLETTIREVEGIDGLLEVVELRGTCKACRRSFFPSSASDGDGLPPADA